jgi:hypothetical protein
MAIFRGGDVNWPPKSCDLTPLDFFLWNKSQSVDTLKVNIINVIAQIQADLWGSAFENWTTRISAIKRAATDKRNIK